MRRRIVITELPKNPWECPGDQSQTIIQSRQIIGAIKKSSNNNLKRRKNNLRGRGVSCQLSRRGSANHNSPLIKA
jgi:hypothetical protein